MSGENHYLSPDTRYYSLTLIGSNDISMDTPMIIDPFWHQAKIVLEYI